MRATVVVATVVLLAVVPCIAAPVTTAIIVTEQTPLRDAPRDSARPQAVLWQGEAVEVRAERMDYLQVYDYRRERGGFVRASHVRRIDVTAQQTVDLLAIVRFLRDSPGNEALGVGLVAAYIQAAPAALLQSESGADALESLGTFAQRLAQRASTPGALQSNAAAVALSAQLDVAARYGITFVTFESGGHMKMCYDGDAFRRLMRVPARPEQQARAALALTRPDCIDPALKPTERVALDESRAQLIDQVDASALPNYLRNRVLMRRAAIWAGLAYQRARTGDTAKAAAARAIDALAGVVKVDLTDDDKPIYAEAAMRVNASRWAAISTTPPAGARDLSIITSNGASGETCVALTDTTHDASRPLLRRCTYGIVWNSSITVNREGTAAAVAVQNLEAWRELWVMSKTGKTWTVRVIPPAPLEPEVGYAEFAGWVPGGKQVLVAREARGEGKYKRAFEVLKLDTLAVERSASDPSMLAAFQRWQDPGWKGQTVALR